MPKKVAATRSASCSPLNSPNNFVGKGRNETSSRRSGFSLRSTDVAWSRYSVMTVWASHTAPMHSPVSTNHQIPSYQEVGVTCQAEPRPS